MANKNQIDLHSAGSFDYLYIMRKQKPETEFRNRIIGYYLEGIINIIKQIENNLIPNTVEIVATSYFFNDRTMNKLGFLSKEPSLFYRINLLINFIDLTWMYSLSKGRFSIPKLWNAKKASISGAALIENKAFILELHKKLNKGS